MSSSANAWRADYRIQPSHRLAAGVLVLHGLAAIAIGLAYAPGWLKLVCWLLMVPLTWRSWRQARLLPPESVVAIREYGDDWWIETAGGEGIRVVLMPELVTWRHLVVMRFAELTPLGWGRRYYAAVLRDSLPPEGFRRLYVRLKFRKTASTVDATES